MNGNTSSQLPISWGVPQGSILGPFLFLLYINDLQDVLIDQNVYLYADDTVIFSTDKDLRLAHFNVQRNMSNVLSWCQQNKLTINIKKNKVMTFGTNNMLKRAHPPPIRLGNDELQYVLNLNYLGVKLDNKLNYESHALECVRQVSHKLYTLTKIRPLINDTQALCLYKSKILPYLDYGNIFYNKTFKRTLLKLQKLQNRALKLCLQKDHLFNTDLLHVEANVPKLDTRRICHITNFAFSRAHDPNYTRDLDRNVRAGGAPLLYEPFSRCESFRRSAIYQCALHWNALPLHECSIVDYTKFKALQKAKMRALP